MSFQYQQFFGDKLTNAKGETIETSSLNGKSLGIYFSAHWCPPCRGFTPMLAEFYNKNAKNKNFEIVFVSSDQDQEKFKEYLGEMPWLALPYEERQKKEELSKKWKVRGIPTFVIVDSDGNTVTDDGRSKVVEDPDAAHFPWKPKPFWEIFKGPLINGKGDKIEAETLKSKEAFGIYFSAHWCPPCRGFTPELAKFYKDFQEKNKSFEIVFASSDKDETSFKEYFSEMPWLAIPFGDDRKKQLSSLYEIQGIPSLVIIDGPTGNVITKGGRSAVSDDPEGKQFPWYVGSIDTAEEELNSEACLIYLNKNLPEDAPSTLTNIFKQLKPQWDNKPQPLYFFYGKDNDMGERIKEFVGLQDTDPVLLILNIPEQQKYIYDGKDFSEANIKTFAENFIKGNLKSVGIKE